MKKLTEGQEMQKLLRKVEEGSGSFDTKDAFALRLLLEETASSMDKALEKLGDFYLSKDKGTSVLAQKMETDIYKTDRVGLSDFVKNVKELKNEFRVIANWFFKWM